MELNVNEIDLKKMDTVGPCFHQTLTAALEDLTEQLQQLVAVSETERGTADDGEALKSGIWEVMESYNYTMQGLESFVSAIKTETAMLDNELESLEVKKQSILEERDILIEKGHELNCRLGYNALERKLDETFSSIERYTNEESAKCFKDEAEEKLKQTNNLIRIANIRACQLDRETFKEMEKITNLFENYERDREYYVKELDLFSEIRRHHISLWLSEPRMDAEREKGENILDYLNLSQRQRHMEAQVIKNTLRMYSFNASLNFDREDNLKMMEELTNLQNKVNTLSGVNSILPRSAKAKTDLTVEEKPSTEDDEMARGDNLEEEEVTGKGLHRCPRKINLATDPLTDPKLVSKLESLTRWEEAEECLSLSMEQHENSYSEPHSNLLTSSSSTLTEVKATLSLCGDAEAAHKRPSFSDVTDATGLTKTKSECKQMESHPSHHNFLSHFESSTVLPGTADRQMLGLVRRRHSSRPVGSLTNLMDTEKVLSGQRVLDTDVDSRDARSQGSEHMIRPTPNGNKSREHVPNTTGCD